MTTYSASDIDAPALWLLTHSSKPQPAQTPCKSLRDAITKAYEFNAAGSVPISLVEVGTANRLDAHDVLALWREHSFALPST